MPTYEYGCAACGNEWEATQRITEPPLEVCPKCGKSSAHRLISAGTGFILKGGGWYSDLYSSAKPAGSKAEAGGAAASSDSGGKADAATAKADGGGSKPSETTTSSPATPAASTPASTPTTPTT